MKREIKKITYYNYIKKNKILGLSKEANNLNVEKN